MNIKDIAMTFDPDFDPERFGLWPKAVVYDGLRPGGDSALETMARDAILDTKAEKPLSALDDLQDMLNAMTRELRQQMQQFRMLREQAEERLVLSVEEIDRKIVQADAKASIEAMSVIVRTLEKIDSLQRTIAHDKQAESERNFDEEAYKAFVAACEQQIERRAAERAADRRRACEDDCAGADDGMRAGAPQGDPPG